MSCSNYQGSKIMQTIKVKPVRVLGTCPAGLTPVDEFQVEDMRLENPHGSRLCFMAVGQMPVGQGIWQLQAEERFFSHFTCPGCTSQLEQENRVVFLLGHADKWKLCCLISDYLALAKRVAEPVSACRAREAAMRCQEHGDFLQAEQQMETALRELERLERLGGPIATAYG
jgi:hypothetical protein